MRKLVIGTDGKVVCPFCSRGLEYSIEDEQVLIFDACSHMEGAEVEILPSGEVEFLAEVPLE